VAPEITNADLAARLDALIEKLDRLVKLADEAAPFLDSPLARYLAARRKAGHGTPA
jgi:hypothetical protein